MYPKAATRAGQVAGARPLLCSAVALLPFGGCRRRLDSLPATSRCPAPPPLFPSCFVAFGAGSRYNRPLRLRSTRTLDTCQGAELLGARRSGGRRRDRGVVGKGNVWVGRARQVARRENRKGRAGGDRPVRRGKSEGV